MCARAEVLIRSLDLSVMDDSAQGLRPKEFARSVDGALSLPEIAALSARRLPELSAYGSSASSRRLAEITSRYSGTPRRWLPLRLKPGRASLRGHCRDVARQSTIFAGGAADHPCRRACFRYGPVGSYCKASVAPDPIRPAALRRGGVRITTRPARRRSCRGRA